MPKSDVSKMKVVELKRELKLRGLPITGNKAELQGRLQNAQGDGDLNLEDTASSGEDLLEEVFTDEEESAVSTLPPELLKSPTSELNPESPTDNSDDVAKETVEQPKNIVLKRKMSTTTLNTESTTTAVKNDMPDIAEHGSSSPDKESKKLKLDEKPKLVTQADLADVAGSGSGSPGNEVDKLKLDVNPKQVIKLSALALEERLQLRVKKFGLEVSGPKLNSITAGGGPKDVDLKQIETLKKRAERFGCVVSSTIAKITTNERMEKRKQRFRDQLPAQVACKDIYAEKARRRLERFKIATK